MVRRTGAFAHIGARIPVSPRARCSASCNLFAVQPHRAESFKLSTDTLFIEKLRDVVGLYLNPPDNALVLCVDEKSQCKPWNALSRCCRWASAMPKGSPTTTSGTAPPLCLPPLTCSTAILAACKPRHRHQEFLGFLRAIEAAVPARSRRSPDRGQLRTHKHAKVKAWLATRPRWHLHFMPTYSSWLNLVERFFALITTRAIRRGSFRSVRELIQHIDHFVTHHN